MALGVSGCVTSTEIIMHTSIPAGYYSNEDKHRIARKNGGAVEKLNRREVLYGSGQGVAQHVCSRLAYYGDRHMVCRVRRVDGVLVVYAAQNSKLQEYLHSNRDVFNMELMPYMYRGLVVPVRVDFQRGHRQSRYHPQYPNGTVVLRGHIQGPIANPRHKRISRFCQQPKNYKYNPNCRKYRRGHRY